LKPLPTALGAVILVTLFTLLNCSPPPFADASSDMPFPAGKWALSRRSTGQSNRIEKLPGREDRYAGMRLEFQQMPIATDDVVGLASHRAFEHAVIIRVVLDHVENEIRGDHISYPFQLGSDGCGIFGRHAEFDPQLVFELIQQRR
jgi:hypothetical protein